MNNDERNNYSSYDAQNNGSTASLGHKGSGPELMSAGSLTGDDVFNFKDEKIGSVKEIMLDMRNGRVSYAVLSFGGFLSMGEKLFAVPWQALKLDSANKRFLLDIDKERLEIAPGFSNDNWPDMADSAWALGIHSHYGTRPYID